MFGGECVRIPRTPSGTPLDSANNINQNKSDNIDHENYENNVPQKKNCNKKQKSVLPQLIDNKSKHLQKNLSQTQRDNLLFDELKEDIQFVKM